MPSGEQQRLMRRFAGACLYVFDNALALLQERHKVGEKNLGYAALCKALTEWKAKPGTLWLNETPSQALQEALKDAERAYANFFAKRAGFPRFKKIGVSGNFCYPDPKQISLDPGDRRNFLHKTSAATSKNRARVCIEDLQVRNMSMSAAGTVEKPGRNVMVKSGLDKSILDPGWCGFRRQLDYKLHWVGGFLGLLSPQNASRMRPACGLVARVGRTLQARFPCGGCSFAENADAVGAINVLSARRGRPACEAGGAASGRPQQEPAEAIQKRFNAAPERRRIFRPSGRRWCQKQEWL